MTEQTKKINTVQNILITSQRELDEYFSGPLRHMDDFNEITIVKQDMKNKNFQGVSFSHCTFDGIDISGSSFRYCNFNNATFRDITCHSTLFYCCDFEDADLSDNLISSTQFSFCDMVDTDFNRCTFDATVFAQSALKRATFNDVIWKDKERSNFSYCNMTGVNISKIGIRSFQISNYPEARYWDGTIIIGCQIYNCSEWLARGKTLGNLNRWPEDVIDSYYTFIEQCAAHEKKHITEDVKKRYFVCTVECTGRVSTSPTLIIKNTYFDKLNDALTLFGEMVGRWPYSRGTTHFEVRDTHNDTIVCTTKDTV